MFTGIIEATGTITAVEPNSGNKTFWLESPLSTQLRVDQSVSHNGVCLTVEEVKGNSHRVTAITETLLKSNLHGWEVGKIVNLERCLRLDSRLDGHLVQGHVDTIGRCRRMINKKGSVELEFDFPGKFGSLIIDKGSICVEGVSLTAFSVKRKKFTVAIVPYTLEHTTLSSIIEGDTVNLEFDMVGKYIVRKLSLDK
jgi:riboflavin synthase